jgi:molecular chaperone DnaJ
VVNVSLNFLDPKTSIKKKIKLNPLITCKTCVGKGAEKPQDITVCSQCNGNGQVVAVQNTFLGQVRQAMTCPTCQGSGQEIKNKCTICKGKGLIREEKEVEVTIPAGIYDGANMRLSGIGDAGRNGGPAGDIYLNLHVKDHPVLKREGAEVYSQLVIDFTDAALGAKLDIETINGIKTLELKPGTQSGAVEILKTEGFPKINNPARNGDHHVSIIIKTPSNLSSKEKELLKELQKLRHKN